MRLLFIVISLAVAAAATSQPIQLSVDATDAPGFLIHVHETIPVSPGAIVLYYPQWIPGAHGPHGPLGNVIELHFHAKGQEIAWDRDDVDSYEFHVDVPAGASQLDVDFVDANPPNSSLNANLARISWIKDLLYPGGKPSDDIQFQANLKLPTGWEFGTALPIDRREGDTAYFQPISLTRLVDDPVVAGKFFNKVVLTEDPLQEMDIAGDTPDDVQVPPAILDNMKRLVKEEMAYFGARHYNDYHFLLTASAYGAYAGLEHNESSEDGLGIDGMRNASELGYLVCHEFTHSWNGKFRRPAGLATPNYEYPMKGELLWVYEGFTEFTGTMLTARTGFWTNDELREHLAQLAGMLETEEGRSWRPVADTARAVHDFGNGSDWGAERRSGADYYYESVLIWLEVDSIIRKLTNDHKSIDDFARAFYGPPSTGPIIKPYTLKDIVAALNSVAPYDWARFIKERWYSVQPHAPVKGIETEGWRVVYNNEPSTVTGRVSARVDAVRFSLGLSVGDDGTINDAIFGMPAFNAGVRAGVKITRVNGVAYTAKVLEEAVRKEARIRLTLTLDGMTTNRDIGYTGGLNVPHLVRDETKPDELSELIKPHAG